MMLLDSKEELYFTWYLDELKEAGVVAKWERSETYILADNVKTWSRKSERSSPKSSVILRDQTYTPDFKVFWDSSSKHLDNFVSTVHPTGSDPAMSVSSTPFMSDTDLVSVLEVKGGFTEHDETRIYSILSKWMWAKFGIYVQKVVVSNKRNSIFHKTFTPKKFLLTDKKQDTRKIHYEVRLLNELLS